MRCKHPRRELGTRVTSQDSAGDSESTHNMACADSRMQGSATCPQLSSHNHTCMLHTSAFDTARGMCVIAVVLGFLIIGGTPPRCYAHRIALPHVQPNIRLGSRASAGRRAPESNEPRTSEDRRMDVS